MVIMMVVMTVMMADSLSVFVGIISIWESV
jgi:hypothetical protein